MISTDNMSEEELWLGCASGKIIEFFMQKEQLMLILIQLVSGESRLKKKAKDMSLALCFIPTGMIWMGMNLLI